MRRKHPSIHELRSARLERLKRRRSNVQRRSVELFLYALIMGGAAFYPTSYARILFVAGSLVCFFLSAMSFAEFRTCSTEIKEIEDLQAGRN